MDTEPASPSSSVLVGPSPLWRLADRRSRKTGSGNIFSNVNLCQLQKLFRVAGDQDAEQRAHLIWGHRDEAELAQALIGLRARSHRRGLRSNGKDALGSHWLRAFNHLRIGENSSSSQRSDTDEEGNCKEDAQRSPEPCRQTSIVEAAQETGAKLVPNEDQGPTGPFERQVKTTSGLKRGGESNPEKYLHRILH